MMTDPRDPKAPMRFWPFGAAACELGLSAGRITQLVKEGKLGTVEVHGRIYVSDFSLRAYKQMKEQKVTSNA
jgi:hypothetical protein